MQGKYPFEIQSHYPHMKPHDVHIWEKFIHANAGFFNSVDYDVCVGRAPEWLEREGSNHAKSQEILHRKKIDVVGYTDDAVWLVEIKPSAAASALGQVLTYKPLYMIEYPQTPSLRLAILTNQAQNQYDKVFDHHGVRLLEVGVCNQCAHYPQK